MAKPRGPTELVRVLRNTPDKTLLSRALVALEVEDVLNRALTSRGLPRLFGTKAVVTMTGTTLTVHCVSAPVATKIRQLTPTLEKALFEAGYTLSVAAVRADKRSSALFEEPTVEGDPREASPEAADAVEAEAMKAEDPEIKKALLQLAKALRNH